jgi:hypothetical protein
MTQRAPTPWLVTLPAGDTTHVTRSSFAAACRGHEKIGEVLGYFVYEASWQAKNEGLDVQSADCTFITIHREAKQMLTRMNVCQKSLIAYIKQLSEWGFITADGYRHTYQVHFQAINAAIQHPPEAIKRKPRGQHAPKPDVKVQSSEKLSHLQSSLVKLQSRLVKIQSETVNLQTRIVNLQTRIVKIQSSESCESALEQGVMGDTEAPRIYKNSNRRNKNRDSLVVSAHAESDGGTSLSLSSSVEKENEPLGEEIPEGQQNGNAPPDQDVRRNYDKSIPHLNASILLTEGQSQEERRVSVLPDEHLCEVEGLEASTSLQQDTIPEYAAQEQSTPPEGETSSKNKTKKKRNSQTRISIKDCSPEIAARRRKWQDFYNQRRGGELLPGKGERIDESKCIADLIDLYTDTQLQAIDTFVTSEIFPHKLPINTHKVGARVDFNEAQNAREVLKERGQWPGQTPLIEKSEIHQDDDAAEEFGAVWGINELRSMSYAAH